MFFQVYLFSLFWLEIKLSVCCWLNLCTVILSTGDPRFKGYFFFRIYTRLKLISHLDSICCTLLRTCNLYKGNFDLGNIFEITDYITALKFELECAVSSCHICSIPTPGSLILNRLQEAKTIEKSWLLITNSNFNAICCSSVALLHPNLAEKDGQNFRRAYVGTTERN